MSGNNLRGNRFQHHPSASSLLLEGICHRTGRGETTKLTTTDADFSLHPGLLLLLIPSPWKAEGISWSKPPLRPNSPPNGSGGVDEGGTAGGSAEEGCGNLELIGWIVHLILVGCLQLRICLCWPSSTPSAPRMAAEPERWPHHCHNKWQRGPNEGLHSHDTVIYRCTNLWCRIILFYI